MEPPMEINVDTSDALEMGPVDAGEYKVQILKAQFKSGEGMNGPWKAILLTLDIPDELSSDIFSNMVWIPDQENQEAKRFERSKSDFNKFKVCFGFAPSEAFTLDDLVGKEGWAYLTIDENEEYGDRNKVQRWITGPGESDSGAGGYRP